MTEAYDIEPKIPILGYGTIVRTKCDIVCSKDWHPDEGYDYEAEQKQSNTVAQATKNNQSPPPPPKNSLPEIITIPKDSILFYVKDSQFMGMSKVEKKSLSAWIRINFITDDQRKLWTTLLCSPQRIWDFETYRRKKKMIKNSFDEVFEVISTGD